MVENAEENAALKQEIQIPRRAMKTHRRQIDLRKGIGCSVCAFPFKQFCLTVRLNERTLRERERERDDGFIQISLRSRHSLSYCVWRICVT